MTNREIDKLLATEVMGWNLATIEDDKSYDKSYWEYKNRILRHSSSWSPTSDYDDLFLLVDKLREKSLLLNLDETAPEHFRAIFYNIKVEDPHPYIAYAPNRCLAICKAALAVKGIKTDEE